ncbi:type I-E CRISPR-associated protein Cas6/Cse3/CasE [Desulforhopalus singaporensis]|uniref:CRISPR-associated protein, Cse3 family n=1 Tax=Desulforhopalus singaporensis TaxID=91360 RepID=A0A1H0TUQ9_9BACT|nr:type I-E CRISPR-associated protein Cas6/Cse3/CasE [Desulforhopalus singaporensis]SDP57777.1 CRISPR-associated protein, Cse3 family [Desulforhopalus singaporensis]
MNWLAQIVVDAETAHIQRIRDSYSWHQKLWDCFPNDANTQRDFLTRIDLLDRQFCLWVLSRRQPQRPTWCPVESFACKAISDTFLAHSFYAFDIRVNAVKSIVQRDEDGQPLRNANGKRKRGKRVPLVNQDELAAWFCRKGEVRCRDGKTGADIPGGFRLVKDRPLEISSMKESYFNKKGCKAYHGGVQFRGTLEVTDQKYFAETYRMGIGSAKGFGFGLFLLAPIQL